MDLDVHRHAVQKANEHFPGTILMTKPFSSTGSRREFFADIARGAVSVTVGAEVAGQLGLSAAWAEDAPDRLGFGRLEPLVDLMQETSADRLLPLLTARLRDGASLRDLVAAGALANARSFGGEDYVGYHTLMALAPAYSMAQELPSQVQPVAVFKVLYRNTRRINEHGGRRTEVLRTVTPIPTPEGSPVPSGDSLRAAVRQRRLGDAESTFAALVHNSAEEAFNSLLQTVQDATEVHRVVLPYRAWELAGILGRDHAHTLLRQSVRYCVAAEAWAGSAQRDEPRTLLPRLLEKHGFPDRGTGDRDPGDAWLAGFSETLFRSTGAQAAEAMAAALAEGIAPAVLGEALTLSANQLILRDHGRTAREESPGKPIGSVHGDSIGVHACDSANAWRNMSRIGNARNRVACLILGAYQVALDRTQRGGDFANWTALPVERHVDEIKATEPSALLRLLDDAIRGNLQARACAVVERYAKLGHEPRPVFDLLLQYAVSEDGSLHAEKFYRTVSEEFATTRPAFRWRHLTALARVTASEFGRPAAGIAEARSLLAAI
jgi:hypothetical protein